MFIPHIVNGRVYPLLRYNSRSTQYIFQTDNTDLLHKNGILRYTSQYILLLNARLVTYIIGGHTRI